MKIYKKTLTISLSTAILLGLVGCSNKEEPKEELNTEPITAVINDNAKVSFYYAKSLEINNQRFGDIDMYMTLANKELKTKTGVDSKVINMYNHLLNSAYSEDVKKDDLLSYLFDLKGQIESNGGKYTKEIKEQYEYKYINMQSFTTFFNLLFPIKDKDLDLFKGDIESYTLISYNTTEKTKAKDLEAVKEDLKDVTTRDEAVIEGKLINKKKDYKIYNIDSTNPLASKQLIDTLETKKVKDVFIDDSDKENLVVYKLINKEKLDSTGKKAVIELLAYTEYSNQLGSAKAIAMDLIKTLDSQSDNISISKEAYKDIENELENMTDEEKMYFINLGLTKYLETNYYVL